MLHWMEKNKETLAVVGGTVAGASAALLIAPTLTIKASMLVATGTCLAIGFWAGKKVTEKIDSFLLKHDEATLQRLKTEFSKYTSPTTA